MELKKGASRKIVQAGAPKQIWDDELDFKAYMRSHRALDIYVLQGEFPEAVMSCGTSDIRHLYEHGLYYWVVFRDKTIQ